FHGIYPDSLDPFSVISAKNIAIAIVEPARLSKRFRVHHSNFIDARDLPGELSSEIDNLKPRPGKIKRSVTSPDGSCSPALPAQHLWMEKVGRPSLVDDPCRLRSQALVAIPAFSRGRNCF